MKCSNCKYKIYHAIRLTCPESKIVTGIDSIDSTQGLNLVELGMSLVIDLEQRQAVTMLNKLVPIEFVAGTAECPYGQMYSL